MASYEAKTDNNNHEPRKLNIFQRGILQETAYIIISLGCGAIAMLLLDRFEKLRFVVAMEKARQQDIISQEIASKLKIVINALDATDAFAVITLVFLSFFVIWKLMRRATGLNWSWPVNLPRAWEFSSAMRKIGKLDFGDQLDYIAKHRLRVYIATEPILRDQDENVRAKLYPVANNSFLVLKNILTTNIGERKLCLDADDYEAVYQQYSLTTKDACYIRVAELEEEVKILKGGISIKETDCAKLIQEKTELREQLAVFQKKGQTAKARESNLQKGEQKKEPFWRVAGPLIHKLITDAEAQPGIKYTRPQIQAEFEKALERHPDLKPIIADLLETPTKKADKTPFDLDGWGMDFLRAALGDYVSRERGRPKAA